jgi:hypothetical protein
VWRGSQKHVHLCVKGQGWKGVWVVRIHPASSCLSVHLSVCRSVGRSVRPSVGPSVHLSVGWSVGRTVRPSVGRSIRRSVRPPVHSLRRPVGGVHPSRKITSSVTATASSCGRPIVREYKWLQGDAGGTDPGWLPASALQSRCGTRSRQAPWWPSAARSTRPARSSPSSTRPQRRRCAAQSRSRRRAVEERCVCPSVGPPACLPLASSARLSVRL